MHRGRPDPGLADQDSFGPSLQDTLYVWAKTADHRTKGCSLNIRLDVTAVHTRAQSLAGLTQLPLWGWWRVTSSSQPASVAPNHTVSTGLGEAGGSPSEGKFHFPPVLEMGHSVNFRRKKQNKTKTKKNVVFLVPTRLLGLFK